MQKKCRLCKTRISKIQCANIWLQGLAWIKLIRREDVIDYAKESIGSALGIVQYRSGYFP